ncbi:MAG: hypothetical protein U9N77_08280 [Thermodesulfobacteriota bacterium]|nr:hypothetical protein [Thermodesulfobacteriota bacterium]
MNNILARSNNIVLFIFLYVTCILSTASAETTEGTCCITQFKHGTVNWTTGKVQAKGKAAPPEKKMSQASEYILSAAKADASKHLISILKTIRLNSEKSVDQHIASQDTIMAGIEKIATNAIIAEQHYASDRSMEVTLETCILRGFLQLVLPNEIIQIPTIEYRKSEPGERDPETEYTGLVIDARGLEFQPVIYPVIVSEQGDEIYSSLFISREYAVQQGVCKYICSMDIALKTERAGTNPLVIKGLRKGRESNSTIVITWSDAEKIEKAIEHYTIMRECRVVILLDQQPDYQ